MSMGDYSSKLAHALPPSWLKQRKIDDNEARAKTPGSGGSGGGAPLPKTPIGFEESPHSLPIRTPPFVGGASPQMNSGRVSPLALGLPAPLSCSPPFYALPAQLTRQSGGDLSIAHFVCPDPAKAGALVRKPRLAIKDAPAPGGHFGEEDDFLMDAPFASSMQMDGTDDAMDDMVALGLLVEACNSAIHAPLECFPLQVGVKDVVVT